MKPWWEYPIGSPQKCTEWGQWWGSYAYYQTEELWGLLDWDYHQKTSNEGISFGRSLSHSFNKVPEKVCQGTFKLFWQHTVAQTHFSFFFIESFISKHVNDEKPDCIICTYTHTHTHICTYYSYTVFILDRFYSICRIPYHRTLHNGNFESSGL